MNCQVCSVQSLDLRSRLPLSVGLSAKCKNCDARYKPAGFLNFLIGAILYLLCHILFIASIVYLSVWLLFIGAAGICFITLYRPLKLASKDPVNEILKRKYGK
jgi:amino acid permease